MKRDPAYRDSANAVEKIHVAAPAAGNYTIRVKGENLRLGRHPERVYFALVAAQS